MEARPDIQAAKGESRRNMDYASLPNYFGVMGDHKMEWGGG